MGRDQFTLKVDELCCTFLYDRRWVSCSQPMRKYVIHATSSLISRSLCSTTSDWCTIAAAAKILNIWASSRSISLVYEIDCIKNGGRVHKAEGSLCNVTEQCDSQWDQILCYMEFIPGNKHAALLRLVLLWLYHHHFCAYMSFIYPYDSGMLYWHLGIISSIAVK